MMAQRVTRRKKAVLSGGLHPHYAATTQTIAHAEGMEIVRRIEPVTFDMKEDGRHSAGVIAQQLREVMPYAVSETKDGTLVVEYSQMIAPMISAIQSLDDRVTALENAR